MYEWEILFSRLKDGEPAFRQAPKLPPAQVWPDSEPLTPAYVWMRTKFLLLMMLHTPAVFYNKELHSVQYTLDLARSDLLKLMWRRLGLRTGKRAKHMSEIFPADWLISLNDTYPARGGGSLLAGRAAAAHLRFAGRTSASAGEQRRRLFSVRMVRAARCVADA